MVEPSLGRSNMYYCMFINSYNDMLDICEQNGWNTDNLSKQEKDYRNKLLKLLREISAYKYPWESNYT